MHRLKIHTSHTEEEAKKSGIYILICHERNIGYVGQTRRGFIIRWLEHQGTFYKNKHSSHIQRLFNKFGSDAFEFRILEYLPDELQEVAYNRHRIKDLSELTQWLNDREVWWVKHIREQYGYRSLCNADDGGGGVNPSPELRAIRSRNQIVRMHDQEVIDKLSRKLRKHYAEHPETHQKLSTSVKAYYANPDNKERISKQRKGIKKSESWKKNASATRKRLYETTDLAQRITEAIKKTTHTAEFRKKCSENSKRIWRESSPELRERMSFRGHHHSESTCQHITKILKDKWQDPKYRMIMYRGRGIPETMVWIDFCLHDIFVFYPHLKKLPPIRRFSIFQQICRLHS